MLRRAGLRAGAQHHQAGCRAPARRCRSRGSAPSSWRCCSDDARPGGARADRRQRADSQQRRPLVQRADGRSAVVGATRSPATTTRSGSGWSSTQAPRHGASARRRRPRTAGRRRRCATRSPPEVDAGAGQAGRGVSRRAVADGPVERGAGCRRRGADAAARLRAGLGRSAGGAARLAAATEPRVVERSAAGGELIRGAAADAQRRRRPSPASWSPATT